MRAVLAVEHYGNASKYNGFKMKNLVKAIKLMRCSHYIWRVKLSTRAYENILFFFFPISILPLPRSLPIAMYI